MGIRVSVVIVRKNINAFGFDIGKVLSSNDDISHITCTILKIIFTEGIMFFDISGKPSSIYIH